MELIEIFFYKLSRLIYSIWDLIVEYFNGTPFYEKIYLGVLALPIIAIFVVINRLVLDRSFKKRIKKYGLLEFKNSEDKPSEPTSDEEETVVEHETVDETTVEKDSTVVQEQKTIVHLSPEVEELISERMDVLALKLEDSILTQLQKNSNHNNTIDQDTKETPVIEVEDHQVQEEIQETAEDTVEEHPIVELDKKSSEEVVLETVDEVTEEEPAVEVEHIKEEPQKDTPKPQDDFDPFFDTDTEKTYIVSKHSISGWQVKKVGAVRASRLFNTKKQAINYAIKQKYEYEVK